MVAVVSGIGPGLGASLCRHLCAHGIPVAGIARTKETGETLENELNSDNKKFRFYSCDISNFDAVKTTVSEIHSDLGKISSLIHNAGALTISGFQETELNDFRTLWETNCLGAAVTTKAVLPDMLEQGSGTLLFTGATAALRGGANFSAFASSKFALRGLVQSLAREFGPKGIHAANVIVDGLIYGPQAVERFGAKQDTCLSPNKIAEQYLNVMQQDRSAWTQELDLRPYSENF